MRSGVRSWWCKHVIDDDMTVNDVPHQTVYCGKRTGPGETRCPEHLVDLESADSA